MSALRYAARRARGVGAAGAHVDEFYAEELVADVLGDTLLGVIAWDPSTTVLSQHVQDAIRSRTWHDRKRARKYQHHRMDLPSIASEPSVRGEVEGFAAA